MKPRNYHAAKISCLKVAFVYVVILKNACNDILVSFKNFILLSEAELHKYSIKKLFRKISQNLHEKIRAGVL